MGLFLFCIVTGGLDVYYVNYHIFLAPEYKDVIQQTEQLLTQACLFSPETSWYIKVLTTGLLFHLKHGMSKKKSV